MYTVFLTDGSDLSCVLIELSAVCLSAFSDVRLDGRTPWNTGRSSAWNTGRSSVLTGFSYNPKARPGQPADLTDRSARREKKQQKHSLLILQQSQTKHG